MPHRTFAFFTTEPNDVVGAVHPKAMPVILTSGEDQATWFTTPWSEARKLQRPLANGELEIVHRTALEYLPGVEGIPSGDPLRIGAPRVTMGGLRKRATSQLDGLAAVSGPSVDQGFIARLAGLRHPFRRRTHRLFGSQELLLNARPAVNEHPVPLKPENIEANACHRDR